MAGKIHVDAKGMREKVAHRGLLGVVQELVSNAFDEDVTFCDVLIELVEGRTYRIRVEDDSPTGFRNLAESYTLFAPSYKAKLADKRGRYNLGDKIAIVMCKEARIESTTGTVIFTDNDTKRSPKKRDRGTVFDGTIVSTKEEVDATIRAMGDIIAPPHVKFTVNTNVLPPRVPVYEFRETLPTVIEVDDGEGGRYLKPSRAETRVVLYKVNEGEDAMIYELGIPVVKPGNPKDSEPFHINVFQKVPTNMDRDNVTPQFLREVRRAVVNHASALIPADRINSTGVKTGIAGASKEAINTVLDKLVGKDRAIQDPSDPEAENKLKGGGTVIIPGGFFTKEAWDSIKETGAARPAGEIAPSPKPYSDDPNAPPVQLWPDSKVTPAMRLYREFVETVAKELLGKTVLWRWVNTNNGFSMCCGPFGGSISYDVNVRRLGVKWFENPPAETVAMVDITIHELGHADGSTHLTNRYYDNLTRLGAQLAVSMLTNPKAWRKFRAKKTDPVTV